MVSFVGSVQECGEPRIFRGFCAFVNLYGKLKATNSNIRQTDVLAQVLNGGIAPCFKADEFLRAGTSPGFGGAARNSVRGPGYFNTDLTVRKNFKLTEKT